MTKRSHASKLKKGIIKQAPEAMKDLIRRQFPYAVMHSCGKPAFFLRHQPEQGRVIEKEDVIFPNGNTLTSDAAECFHCHGAVTAVDMLNVQRVQ